MAYAGDSKSSVSRHAGSSPAARTHSTCKWRLGAPVSRAPADTRESETLHSHGSVLMRKNLTVVVAALGVASALTAGCASKPSNVTVAPNSMIKTVTVVTLIGADSAAMDGLSGAVTGVIPSSHVVSQRKGNVGSSMVSLAAVTLDSLLTDVQQSAVKTQAAAKIHVAPALISFKTQPYINAHADLAIPEASVLTVRGGLPKALGDALIKENVELGHSIAFTAFPIQSVFKVFVVGNADQGNTIALIEKAIMTVTHAPAVHLLPNT